MASLYSISQWAFSGHLVILALTVLVGLAVRQISRMYTLGDLVGPPASSWLFGHEFELQESLVGTRYNEWAKEYGPTYKTKGPLGISYLMVGDPRGASHILNSRNYIRPREDAISLEQFFGRGLFSVEGDKHRKQRGIVNPAFTSPTVREVSHVIFDLALDLKNSLSDELDSEENQHGKILEISSKIPRVTLDAISMTAFAYDVGNSNQSIPNLIAKISDVPQTT
ncbi:uncharacterized protein FIBRA_00630 [Fibroporia radiculosa]|uniref:Cytochrome P450 n=1 Tax=Fibroporia radiculosa TaxID=599839 RepID=J4G0I5_9APHY|nr:uncharacterized protein FIBRA_00630 [Fibroporia radiculosa]CCL98628.1 predicted protein [Fibroporia radiculosa]